MSGGFSAVQPILIVIAIIGILAWCPWATNNFAVNRIDDSVKPCKIGNQEGVIDVGGIIFKRPFGIEIIGGISFVCPEGYKKVEASHFFVSALGSVHIFNKITPAIPVNNETGIQIEKGSN